MYTGGNARCRFSRVNARIGGTAQIEFLDMVGGMAPLSQERGQQKRQVFVNEESRHQAEARTVRFRLTRACIGPATTGSSWAVVLPGLRCSLGL